MTTQKEALRVIYDRRDELFHLICLFNSCPASYVHPSFLGKKVPQAVISQIASSKRARRRFNSRSLKQASIKNKFHLDFSLPRLRLALLDKETLNQLLLYSGIVYYHTHISKIVQKKLLLELKEEIGEDAYFFALKKATFMTRLRPRLTSLNPNPKDLHKSMVTAGQRMLEFLFANEPDPFTQRFALKFPQDTKWNFQRKVEDDDKEQIWTFLHKLLIKEINSKWELCFT